MRPYTSLLAGFSVVAVVVFTACAKDVRQHIPSVLTDMATSNTPYAGANALPFQPNAGGPATIIGRLEGVSIPGVTIATRGLSAFSLLYPVVANFHGPYLMSVNTQDDSDFKKWYFARPGDQTAFSDTLISWGHVFNNFPNTGLVYSSKNRDPNGDHEKNVDYFASLGVHYVIGAQTPVANLPASGVANYSLLGATQPTRASGAAKGDSLDSASLSVQWGGANTKVGVSLIFNKYMLAQTNGGILNPGSSQLTLAPGSTTFGGTLETGDLLRQGPCTDFACRTNVSGFFAGPNAERAGLVYEAYDTTDPIRGAAAFSLNGSLAGGPPAAPVLLTQTNPVTVSIAGGPDISALSPANTGDVTQNADLSLSRINYSTGLFTVTPGTTVSADVGGDQFITWGRWVGGQAAGNVFGGPPGANPGNASLHYIAGIPTPSGALPASGTATFNLLGATSPTFGNGVGGPGTVTAATMAVAWGGAATTKIGLDMFVSMPGDQVYRILTTGGLATPGTSQIHSLGGPNFFGSVAMPATGRACTGGTCTTEVNGFFAGPAAERAALTYTISNGAMANGVFGAAAFKR